MLDDLWNGVVCLQPPSLFIGKVWVPVMHFCVCPIHCKVHRRVGRRLGSYRLISAQLLIGFCVVYTDTVKVKSSMARSLPVENLLPQNVGSIINYLQ